MNYPVATSVQLRPILRALRQSRGLSQAQVGRLLGVNQKRIARIEASPGVTGFEQISRLVTVLGGRMVIEEARAKVEDDRPNKALGQTKAKPRSNSSRAPQSQGDW